MKRLCLTIDEAILSFPIRGRPGRDIHDPDSPDQDTMEDLKKPSTKETYTVNLPYRCLLSQATKGLMTAGRHVSASHSVDFYTGNIVPWIGSGQVAGTAAAMCVSKGRFPKQLKGAELAATVDKQSPVDSRPTPS